MGNVLHNDIRTLLAGIEPERARVLLLLVAFRLTRLDAKMRAACRLVIIKGRAPVDAARKVEVQRQNVSRALRKLRPKLAEVRAAYDEGMK